MLFDIIRESLEPCFLPDLSCFLREEEISQVAGASLQTTQGTFSFKCKILIEEPQEDQWHS